MNKWSQRTLATVGTLIVLAIAVAVNVLLYDRNVRKDLTRDRIYSVSPELRAMLSEFKDTMNVTVYVSPEMPPELLAPRQFVEDFLRELTSIAGPNLRLRVVSMTGEAIEAEKKELEQRGVQPVVAQFGSEGKVTAQQVYFSLVVQYREKWQTLNLPNQGTFEYEFGRALVKVTTTERPKIAFISTEPKSDFLQLAASANESGLSDLFTIEIIEGDSGKPLYLTDKTSLIVVHAKDRFTDRQLFEIDQHLMYGGKMIVFTDGAPWQDQLVFFKEEDKLPNFNRMLEHYGVKVWPELVQDWASCFQSAYETGRRGNVVMMAQGPFPQVLITQAENANGDEFAPLRDFRNLMLPFAARVTPTDWKVPGVTVSTILTTTENADVQTTAPYTLEQPKPGADGKLAIPPKESLKKLPIAVKATGSFPSYFASRETPLEETPDQNDPFGGMRRGMAAKRAKIDVAADGAQVVVFGSSYMLSMQVLRSMAATEFGPVAQSNFLFMMNFLEAMTIGDSLSKIRTKQVKIAYLKSDLTDAQKRNAKLVATFAVPAGMVLFGIGWMVLRRRRLLANARIYGGASA